MNDVGSQVSTVHRKGLEPSIIESFGIRGLYGYQSISLNSQYAATILIARNGTGKTTLLGALDAFLRMQFSRLRNLEFSEIHCKFRNQSQEMVLTHNDVVEFLQVPTEGELIKLASRSDVEASSLFSFLIEDWLGDDDYPYNMSEKRVFSSVLTAFDYNRREAVANLNKVKSSLMERQISVARIQENLRSTLSDIDIVYLPTYRRVELALKGEPRENPYRRRRPKFDVAFGSLFTGEIQFGLSDISDRLSQMNQQIIVNSNAGYREISANIISDLIDGSFEQSTEVDMNIPSVDDLKLFFERLEKGRKQGPYMPVSVPNLDKIYSGENIPAASSRFLSYFLAKLGTVIQSAKLLEAPVDGFIDKCNKYLDSAEPSTSLGSEEESITHQATDGKRLVLNRSNLRIRVESVLERRRITLDALSSGEKQMISLFAKMFLYPGKKIVLIDEPELSLSIDWQREILTDVLNAPLCAQLIAITHSPFVFDNELEPFARAIKLERSSMYSSPDRISEVDIDE